MNLVYLEEARRELLDSVAYYNACAGGLGHQFYAEVQAGEDAILRMPEAWGRVAGGYRRKLLNRFPYGLANAGRDARNTHSRDDRVTRAVISRAWMSTQTSGLACHKPRR